MGKLYSPFEIADPLDSGGGGGGVELTTFTPSGTFAWGTVYAPTEKTLTVTADAGTLPCAALLEFSGDDTAFECYEIEGQELAAPVEVGSLPLNVRYLSWEQGTAITLKFYPLFVDGTAKSCDIVVKGSAGDVVDTLTLSATYADPVRGAIMEATNGGATLVNLATAQSLADGDINPGGVAAEAILGTDQRDYTTALTAESGWASIATGAPVGGSLAGMISKHVRSLRSAPAAVIAGQTVWASNKNVCCAWIQACPDWDTVGTSYVKCGSGVGHGASNPTYAHFKFRRNYLVGATGPVVAPAPTGSRAYFCALFWTGAEYVHLVCPLDGTWAADKQRVGVWQNQPQASMGWSGQNYNGATDFQFWPLFVSDTYVGENSGTNPLGAGVAAMQDIFEACKA